MARFQRDESRTFKLLWLSAGGVFTAVSLWAIYDDGVTRTPWAAEQKSFYALEGQLAKKNLERVQAEFVAHGKAQDDKLKARRAEIEESKKTGSYRQSADKLATKNSEFAEAEQSKTFAKSDLDEAYYYRQLAEYARDEKMNEAREAIAKFDGGLVLANKLFADPPPPPREAGTSDAMYHLEAERSRNQLKADSIDAAKGTIDARVWSHFEEARVKLEETVAAVDKEILHQKRVDVAERTMAKLDGPADPAGTEKDEKVALKKRTETCAAWSDSTETRHCIQWIDLDPLDQEEAAIDRNLAKLERPVTDAQIRLTTATARANPKFEFSAGKLINYVVGVYQIQQVVTTWNEPEAAVEKEQVDRCPSCHMGADSANYTDPTVPRQFRTHPFRSTLFTSHPVEKFGCTSCHQGEGRSTDYQAHSGFVFSEGDEGPRWELQGDKFWEDPLYPAGRLSKIVIDKENDELELKVDAKGAPGDWVKVNIGGGAPHEYANDAEFLGALQSGATRAVTGDLARSWRVVVRKLDDRVTVGLEQTQPNEVIEEADKPTLRLKFTRRELGEMLGFKNELYEHASSYTGSEPPSVTVRSPAQAAWGDKGHYTPPTSRNGLTITPEYRDRFILALPEIEGGCYRCHSQDTDLRPHESKAKWVFSNLDRKKAEAERAAQPELAKTAPEPAEEAADPFSLEDPVPVFSEGRHLFRQLNCTGCHILDNFPGNRNTGPQLNDITAKTNPAWILKWIRYPRAWRHKTKMPNLWPAPIDPAAKVPYAPGTPEYATWETQMKEQTLDVASYLIERSENPSSRPHAQPGHAEHKLADQIAGYANVPGASAEDGKAIFDSYGCRGCHATVEDDLPPAWRARERDIAPNLGNIGSKASEDWIAYWAENPTRYWHGTKMPMLRLDRREAASVAKYLTSLKSEPAGAAAVGTDEVAILKDPVKRNASVACDVAGNVEMSRVACGEKLIANYGCFGCHTIDGFENYAPIAPELNGWAKKDLSQIDYGYAIDDHHQQTHETFAVWKLDSPRIYRRDRIELKMGDFDLSAREIRSLVVFLMGLSPMKPRPETNPYEEAEYKAVLEGRQIVDDYNCRGCHLIEGRGAEFLTARRLIKPDFDEQLGPPHLTGEGARVQPEWLFGFLKAPDKNGIRPGVHPEWVYGEAEPLDKMSVKMPTFPFNSDQATAVVRYFAAWEGAEYPYVQARVKSENNDERLDALLHMNGSNDTGGNCISCHFVGTFPVERGKVDLEKMGPNLGNVYKRLRPEWTRAWIMKPSDWLPYTKMPAFWPDPFGTPLTWTQPPGFAQPKTAEGQIELIRDYLYLLRENSVLPKPGDELRTPVLGLGDDEVPQTPAPDAHGPRATAAPAPNGPAGNGRPTNPGGNPARGRTAPPPATGRAHGALETTPHAM
jgi:cytochrome c2